MHASMSFRRRAGLLLLAAAAALSTSVAFAQSRPAAPPKLCIGDPMVCVDTRPAAGKIKWNPGHYLLTESVGPATLPDLPSVAGEPTVRGYQVRYYWGQLETARDRYDFSLIDAHLAQLRPHGKRLVIQVLDRTWSGTSTTGRLPAYLRSDADLNGGWYVKPDGKGVVAKYWDARVMDRFIALYRALGRRYDGEVLVEAITTEETDPGYLPNSDPASRYTHADIALQMKRLTAATRAAWPNTNVFVYTNWLPREMPGLFVTLREQRAGSGGPDILPDEFTDGDQVRRGTVGGIDYRPIVPGGYAVQEPALCGKEGCYLPQRLFDHAIGALGATHVFWVRMGTQYDTATAKYSWRDGILPTIRRNGGRANSACPTSYAGACRAPGT